MAEMIGVALAIVVIALAPGGLGVVPRVAIGVVAGAVMLLRTMPWE